MISSFRSLISQDGGCLVLSNHAAKSSCALGSYLPCYYKSAPTDVCVFLYASYKRKKLVHHTRTSHSYSYFTALLDFALKDALALWGITDCLSEILRIKHTLSLQVNHIVSFFISEGLSQQNGTIMNMHQLCQFEDS